MPIYRKKPVVIEAVVWPGYEGTEIDAFFTEDEHRNVVEIGEANPDDPWNEDADEYEMDDLLSPLYIKTLEGTMRADPGDYIIRGVNQELYPCKPDVFEATYERVEG